MQHITAQNPVKLAAAKIPPHSPTPSLCDLPQDSYLRRWQLIGCKKRNLPAYLPWSLSTLVNRMASGEFPKPTKLGGGRSVGWKVSEVREYLQSLEITHAA